MEMSRLTRDGTTEPVSRDQILRHARGQGNVKNSKRGACRQKAATVLPDRTAATYCIYSSLSSFEFNIVGYGAPHDA